MMNYAPDPMFWMTMPTTSIQRNKELHLMSCHATNKELNWDQSLTASIRREMVAKHGMDHKSIRDAIYTIERPSFWRPEQI